MKKFIITIIAIVMAICENNANAEIVVTTMTFENVQSHAMRFIPDVTENEIEECYDAVRNGGHAKIKRKRVMIKCAEEEMIVFRRLF